MKQETHNEMTSLYDIVAKSWKGEVVFEGRTGRGESWIKNNWGSVEFRVGNLLSAATTIEHMNYDGLEVALLCGV